MSAADIRGMQSQGIREVIVEREPGLSASQQAALRAQAGVSYVGPGPLPNTELDRTPAQGLTAAVAALERDPQVRYAEPNGEVHATAAPNDAYFGQQWALSNTGQTLGNPATAGTAGDDIGAMYAWGHATGAGVTVAVVDTGVDSTAPDLQTQLTTGWDFIDGNNQPQDQNGHGTHVSGIIAAAQNNGVGVSGVAPNATLMPLRVLDATGQGTLDSVAAAFNYAGDRNVRIVNASLGGSAASTTLEQAIALHPATLYVVAAGNDGSDNDSSPFYPCDLPEANVICVGATDQNDQPASFTNYGATSVDLFAPGVNILSTYPGGYAYGSGTSMAAPMVTGTLALMLQRNPSLTAAQLKADLLANVLQAPQLARLAATGGELDAAAAVAAAGGDAPYTAPVSPAPASGGTNGPAPTPQHSPVRRRGVSLSHVALVGMRGGHRTQALVFTLSARAQVQISLRASAGGRTAADPGLRRGLTGHRGANRYALSSLLHRRLARGHYALSVRAANRVVTLRLNVG